MALRLARVLVSQRHVVTSVIRNEAHSDDIVAQGATPKVLSLEDEAPSTFTSLFESHQADVVYFSAGSGGKGGPERTKKVDYEGAVKIFDAIEAVKGEKKPFLILVSGVEVRDPNKIPIQYVCISPSQRGSFYSFSRTICAQVLILFYNRTTQTRKLRLESVPRFRNG